MVSEGQLILNVPSAMYQRMVLAALISNHKLGPIGHKILVKDRQGLVGKVDSMSCNG